MIEALLSLLFHYLHLHLLLFLFDDAIPFFSFLISFHISYLLQGFELGVEPPPLEEFKRLMESLGPDSMFADDYADSLAADEYIQPEAIP